jgi:hypothetical protein
MDTIIEEVLNYDCTNSSITIENICLLLCPKFKEVDGVIFLNLSDDSIPNKINIEKVIQIYGNLTAYECSCNEIRINDYIQYTEGDGRCILKFALLLQKNWIAKIRKEYPSCKFCFVLSYDGEFATLRFHKIRENESFFLTDDLESYTEEGILEVKI